MADYPRPSLTADVVLLRWQAARLQVLLIERAHDPFAGTWALPGGFVDAGESPRDAALRELAEETGAPEVPLVELGIYGAPGRDPRGWVVTSAWLGFATAALRVTAGDDAARAEWHRLDQLPALAFDHAAILQDARERLRALAQIETTPLILLGSSFRMRAARHLYAQIFDRPMPPDAFKKWMRRREAVERVGPARYRRAPAMRPDWKR